MRNPLILSTLIAALSLTSLAACSPSSSAAPHAASGAVAEAPTAASSVDQVLAAQGIAADAVQTLTIDQYNDIISKGNGFQVGPGVARDVGFVFFDPQCPHCGVLWAQSVALQHSTSVRWMPVAFLNAQSLPQGAALLSAKDGATLMTSHEASMAAHQGGLTTTGDVDQALIDKMFINLNLLKSVGASSVPFMVHKSADGVVRGVRGELTTEQLKAFLGS